MLRKRPFWLPRSGSIVYNGERFNGEHHPLVRRQNFDAVQENLRKKKGAIESECCRYESFYVPLDIGPNNC